MAHSHEHHHSNKKALTIALGITAAFLAAEVVGGILTNSLALLADAGHMLTDVASLVLALIAMRFAARPATPKKTYGYYRAEILAAFVNGVTLVLIALYIFYEAFQRFQTPPEVKSLPMLVIAVFGLLANLASAYVLSKSEGESLNVRGAFLHVVADVLGSVGAIVAGIIMLATRWYLADPLISILIGLLILFSSWRLIRDSINILMEGVPARINVEAIEQAIMNVPNVVQVHDLHVWTLTSSFDALSARIIIQNGLDSQQHRNILDALHAVAHQNFDIEHTTFQLEEQLLVKIKTNE